MLEAGANPNDNESLYHSTEHSGLACMKLLLEHGALPAGANALKHMLDREDAEGLRLLLNAGADPNEVNPRGETALHWAVRRLRSATIIAILLDSGASLNARRNDGRTAYALAALGGQKEITALPEARGADGELSALDSFVAGRAGADESAGAALAPTGDADVDAVFIACAESPMSHNPLHYCRIHPKPVRTAADEAQVPAVFGGNQLDTRIPPHGLRLENAEWNKRIVFRLD